MNEPNEQPERLSSGRAPLQFSLRAMFLATTALAMACGLFFAMPPLLSIPLMLCLNVLFSGLLVAGVVYGRGGARAFCVAAMAPTAILLVIAFCVLVVVTFNSYEESGFAIMMDAVEEYGASYRLVSGTLWVLIVAAGLAGVVIRRLCDAREGSS